jgi:glycosyltransferase involved in cell wall biosynthesis
MINGKKIIVVLPAFNAGKTLTRTYGELPHPHIDEVLLVDDQSSDNTSLVSRELGIRTIIHDCNSGYGSNQKTCYRTALAMGADIVVMIHPDYQYPPSLVAPMASMIASGECDVVLGSRILGGNALQGGMPLYKYVSNRLLTFLENKVLGINLSEYHTGLRAFSRNVLEALPLAENSDDFVFDNEIIVQSVVFGFRIREVACPTRYFPEASSITFWRSVRYGFGVLSTVLKYCMHKARIRHDVLFSRNGRGLSAAGAGAAGERQIGMKQR